MSFGLRVKQQARILFFVMRFFCLLFCLLFLSSCASTPIATANDYGITLQSNFSDWKRVPVYDRDEVLRGAIFKHITSRRDRYSEYTWSPNHKYWNRVLPRISGCMHNLPTYEVRTLVEAFDVCMDRIVLPQN